jgi:gamma-glutamyltranspeptidase/glutathione hydrolase
MRRFALRSALLACVLAACGAPLHTRSPEDAKSTTSAVAAAAPRAPAKPARTLPASSGAEGVAVGIHGAVASAEQNASRAGLEVLRSGGSAVDAAIAVAFALAVTQPEAGNLGGGGFMLVRMASGESVAIDYREVAPRASSRTMYLDASGKLSKDSVNGARAAGVPGTVAGLALAHQRFGKKPWAELIAPAIALARNGHVVDAPHAKMIEKGVKNMRAAGLEGSAHYYLAPDGAPLAEGALWKQPELANTLEQIAQHGPRAFYEGAWADSFVAAMQRLGGVWTSADLAAYKPAVREPLRFTYLGREILSMPPPSAGGIVLRQILFASELLHMRDYPWRSVQALHLFAEAARRAYADRSTWIADPDFVQVPVQQLMAAAYLQPRMQGIDLAHATASSAIQPGDPLSVHESLETTHFSVIDDAGNAVSNTYTLNNSFGALVVVPGTGILLNDEMDDFACDPGKPNFYGLVQGTRNEIAPGKRMLSSMTPTIVLENGELRAVLGSPGGPTITTNVAQLVRALIDYGQPLDVAVRAPRIHHQWLPDRISAEATLEPELVEGLRALGHTVTTTASGVIGHADCVEVDPITHGFRAVADVTRGGGGAVAY